LALVEPERAVQEIVVALLAWPPALKPFQQYLLLVELEVVAILLAIQREALAVSVVVVI
jgi:hypothetical protein